MDFGSWSHRRFEATRKKAAVSSHSTSLGCYAELVPGDGVVDGGFEAAPRLSPVESLAPHVQERDTVSLDGLEHRDVLLDASIRRRIGEAALELITIHTALDSKLLARTL